MTHARALSRERRGSFSKPLSPNLIAGYFALFVLFALFLVGAGLSLTVENPLDWRGAWTLLWAPERAEHFDAFYFAYGTLPRFAAAVLGGAILGLVGSLLQQLTQNPMTSPLTLGTSSGAWLAIVLVSAFAPGVAGDGLALAALTGALSAFGLIVVITGPRAMGGISLVIAGMVVNLLFGALATAVVLLKSEFISNIFLWGAGDLAQNGWAGIEWLLPRTLPIMFAILLFAPRALALISLGNEGARARGLTVVPVFVVLTALGVWLASAFITTAGVINFTGLIAPNIARAAGWQTPRKQLLASTLIGAVLLTATDGLAVLLSSVTESIVPTGVVSAVIGTPLFIGLACRRLKRAAAETVENATVGTLPSGVKRFGSKTAFSLVALLLLVLLFTVVDFGSVATGNFFHFGLFDRHTLSLRLPRLATALFAGAGLAVAGGILQRLIRNPLASPDMLGVSAGATFAMVTGAMLFGARTGITSAGWALGGSLLVLLLILGITRRTHDSPALVVLLGIAVSAFLDAFTTLLLSRGTVDNYVILQWLSGSTYKATSSGAIALGAAVLLLSAFAFALSRSMTLLSVGRVFAASRGLSVNRTSIGLLVLCALLCAVATSAMGPVAFIGLVAPHMAVLLGAKTTRAQLAAAALLGASLVALADWFGRVLIAPAQIPAGTLAAIFGASYFLLLLLGRRLAHRL